jgi:hypothetical protein
MLPEIDCDRSSEWALVVPLVWLVPSFANQVFA